VVNVVVMVSEVSVIVSWRTMVGDQTVVGYLVVVVGHRVVLVLRVVLTVVVVVVGTVRRDTMTEVEFNCVLTEMVNVKSSVVVL
jgi:hypothetical protein